MVVLAQCACSCRELCELSEGALAEMHPISIFLFPFSVHIPGQGQAITRLEAPDCPAALPEARPRKGGHFKGQEKEE